jgi:hypothetical protein
MSKHLYIEDELIDLPPNVVIAQTLQVFDPGRVGSILTNFTSSIRLKDTFLNTRRFGFINNSKAKNDIPYTSLSCKYIENGITLIRNGRVVVNEVNDGISLNVYSGPWGFFEIIQDLTLWDLDFSDINGPWTQAIRDGYRNTTSGIVQALVDDGRLVQDQASTAPTIENQGITVKPPQIYYHTVIEKIFSSAGFEYEGDIFTNDIYLKLVMPLSVIYNDPEFFESRMFFAAAPGTQIMINPVTETDVIFDTNVKQGDLEYYDGVSEYVVDNPDTAADFLRMRFFFDLTITVTGGTVDITFYFNATPSVEETGVGSGTYVHDLDVSLADTDVVKVSIIASTGTPTVTIVAGSFYTQVITGKEGAEFFPNFTQGYVYFQKLIEEHSQIDFLKEFCVRFNVQITQINNKLVINTLNYILDDRSGPDWTQKRDKGRDRIKYAFSTYARTNVIKAPIDDEFTPDLTEKYGDGQFTIPNENIRETFNIYTSLFSPSQMISTFGVFMLDMDLLPDFANFGRMPGDRLFFVREPYAHEPPVLFDSVDRSDYLVGYYFDPNQEYDLGWQFFIDTFHQKFIDRCLRKVRLVEREYNLSDLDIFAFNQQVPIRDNDERFLVTKINSRVSGKVCKVELLKIEANPENWAIFGVAHELTGALVDTMEVMGDTVPPELEVRMELVEDVTGSPTWTCLYDNGQDTVLSVTIGNGSSDTDIIDHVGQVDVDANVLKTDNDGNGPNGFPTNNGWVEWLRDGVQEHTETFNGASPSSAQGLNYTYPDVVAFQILRVVVHEDGTSP